MNRTHHSHHTHSASHVAMTGSLDMLVAQPPLHDVLLLDDGFDELYVDDDMSHIGAPADGTAYQ